MWAIFATVPECGTIVAFASLSSLPDLHMTHCYGVHEYGATVAYASLSSLPDLHMTHCYGPWIWRDCGISTLSSLPDLHITHCYGAWIWRHCGICLSVFIARPSQDTPECGASVFTWPSHDTLLWCLNVVPLSSQEPSHGTLLWCLNLVLLPSHDIHMTHTHTEETTPITHY